MNDVVELLRSADPAVTPAAALPDARAWEELAVILGEAGRAGDRAAADRAAAASPRRRGLRPLLIAGGVVAVGALGAGAFGAVTVLPTLLAPPASMGDWPWYETGEALVERADLVVSGTVGGIRSASFDGIPYRVAEFTVQGVAKGAAEPGSVIEVKFLGATSPSSAALHEGGRYVLLLAVYPDSPASPLNPAQGAYDVSPDGGVAPRQGNTVLLGEEVLARLGLHR